MDQAVKEVRADTALNVGINMSDVFSGRIINKQNISKTSDELVAKWNEDHTNDPVSVVE